MSRLGSVLFWSVISAAFIGPGTVTTAASSGARFGFALLWALSFSTLACLVLQEAGARITVLSGRNLGQALRLRSRRGARGSAVPLLALGSIGLGCAAYEAGNILGGAAGAALGSGVSARAWTCVIGVAAALLLWFGRAATIARLLGLLVAVMGVAFLVTAWRLGPPPAALLRGAVVPSLPPASGLLVLGLVGTTVVPYNLFLGSGLARGQGLGELRFGLSVAVLLGGVVSMAIVVAGTAVEGEFDFASIAEVLRTRLGGGARSLFALGLCAAGVSSAVTAPLAAAITARSLLGGDDHDGGPGRETARWAERGWRFRAAWLGVLAIGVAFGLADVRPVPAIIAAQALNGILLPLVAVFLLLSVNDAALVGRERVNGPAANAVLGLVVGTTVLLGLTNLVRAIAVGSGMDPPGEGRIVLWSSGLVVAGAVPVWRRVRRLREPGPHDRG